MSKKVQAHEIVADYLRVCEKIGHPPSRDEYLIDGNGIFPKNQIIEIFGSWLNLVRAAGKSPSTKARERKNQQEIRLRYYNHLLSEVKRMREEKIDHPPCERLLVIGDIHAPYTHIDYIDFILALNKKYKFDRICLTGDEVDHHAISFHEKDPDLPSAGYELKAAIDVLKPLYEEFPIATIAESNHGSLVYRKGKHHGIPRSVLKSYHDQLEAPPGWRWENEILVTFKDGTNCIIHHSFSSNVLLDSQRKGTSLIFGHHHNKLSVQHWSNGSREFFAAFAGCGIDDKSYAFAYNKNSVLRPELGCVIVIDGYCRAVRMFLDSSGRWDKRVP